MLFRILAGSTLPAMYDFDRLKYLLLETKKKYYSPKIRRLTDNIFLSHRVVNNALDSIALMSPSAQQRGYDLHQYPSIATLVKISKVENNLREATLNAQRKELIMEVNERTGELASYVLDAYMGRFADYAFFEKLIIQAHKLGIDVRRFHALSEYVWINLKMKSLTEPDVKTEILTCVDYLRDDLFETDDQKMIFHIEKEVDNLYNGYRMSLMSEPLEQDSGFKKSIKELETELKNILQKQEINTETRRNRGAEILYKKQF